MKKKKIYISLLIFSLNMLISGCFPTINHSVKAEHGYLDLRYGFTYCNYIVSIDGEWEFYWKEFLSSAETEAYQTGNSTTYIRVPGNWNNLKINKKNLTSSGFATYRLIVDIPSDIKKIGFKMPPVNSSYIMWINNEKVFQAGVPGKSAAETKAQYKTGIFFFEPDSPRLELILHVSNDHQNRAGVGQKILMGDPDAVYSSRESKKAIELFFVGGILMILIYHLWIFLLRRKEKAMLLFSFFCTIILIRILFVGEYIFLEWFPDFDWVWHYRIEQITVYLSPPVMCFFLYHLYPDEVRKIIRNIILISGILAVLLTFILPPIEFAYIFNIYQFIILFSLGYCMYILLQAKRKQKPGALTLLIGMMILTFTVINDILFVHLIIADNFLLPFGFFILIFLEFSIHLKFIRAEDAREITENKNIVLLDALPDIIIYINSLGKILDYKIPINNFLIEQEKFLMHDNLYDILPIELIRQIKTTLLRMNEREKLKVFEYELEKNETFYYYEIRLVKGKEQNYLVVIRDITSGKVTEKQLFHVDKLATVGTLVAGVAHEINNPNNSILLTSENMQQDIKIFFDRIEDLVDPDDCAELIDDDEGYRSAMFKSLEKIRRNSIRIKKIVNDLKQFSARENGDCFEKVDINKVIIMSLQLLFNKVKNSTQHLAFEENKVPYISANFQRLEQVFVNLIQNACDALENKDQGIKITIHFDENQGNVVISIKDQGIGMDQQTQKRILDPFYTTKHSKDGLGLGLFIAYKIIQSYKGSLEFHSIPGKGTTAIVKFPV